MSDGATDAESPGSLQLAHSLVTIALGLMVVLSGLSLAAGTALSLDEPGRQRQFD